MAWTKHGHKPKMVQKQCACGCGEIFGAIVTSNQPKYKNNAHKMRAYRARKKAGTTRSAAKASDNFDARWAAFWDTVKLPAMAGL